MQFLDAYPSFSEAYMQRHVTEASLDLETRLFGVELAELDLGHALLALMGHHGVSLRTAAKLAGISPRRARRLCVKASTAARR